MNILLDMNIPQVWEAFLRDAGHSAIHWSRVGDIRALDEEIMAWARDNDHVVLTHDLDLGSLLFLTNATAPSVVQIRAENVLPQFVGAAVLETLDVAAETLEEGALATIDPRRHRIRLLPLKSRRLPRG
jgi:predicted nuclease of predicted toxin-antitoxin system